MELLLDLDSEGQVNVTYDGQASNTFSGVGLFLEKQGENVVLRDPVETGRRLFEAFFCAGTLTDAALAAYLTRILLVIENKHLDAIPWEYLYDPCGFLVFDSAFVRGLPANRPTINPSTKKKNSPPIGQLLKGYIISWD
jgi:hypothetical protein